MFGMLILFIVLLFLSAYVSVIDKFNGPTETTANIIIWGFFVVYVFFNIFVGG